MYHQVDHARRLLVSFLAQHPQGYYLNQNASERQSLLRESSLLHRLSLFVCTTNISPKFQKDCPYHFAEHSFGLRKDKEAARLKHPMSPQSPPIERLQNSPPKPLPCLRHFEARFGRILLLLFAFAGYLLDGSRRKQTSPLG